LLAWLKGRLEEFDTVYVSGDTDSFAPPRTYQGLALLEALLVLKKDVLFTTRAVLSADARNRMSSIASEYQQAGLRLIACISISQLSHPELEPPPIPSPGKRIEQMSYLKKLGLVTALTIRPFIPGIDPSEYASIASLGARAADVIIGGDLYSDFKGIVRDRIESAGLSMAGEADSIGPLYFSTNESHWFTHKHPAAEGAVAAAAAHAGVPFFMGSEPAIDFIRSQ
jgi:DNA repair photolyase